MKSRDWAYEAQEWRLLWRPIGSRDFQVLASGIAGTTPPLLETDEAANVYMVVQNLSAAPNAGGTLYCFTSASGYRPTVTPIAPGGAAYATGSSAGKWCMFYDRGRRELNLIVGGGRLWVFDSGGVVLRQTALFDPAPPLDIKTPHIVFEYPHLTIDEAGTIYAAWTTQSEQGTIPKSTIWYFDIRTMRSTNQGATWTRMDGTPVAIPGPASAIGDRIIADSDLPVSTWLASFRARHGKLHFLYQAQSPTPVQHYVRYDAATGQNRLDLTGATFPVLSPDGFFCCAPQQSPLYCVGKAPSGDLVCLASDNDGASWYTYATLPLTGLPTEEGCTYPAAKASPYSIGGARELTQDGRIIGTFVNDVDPGTDVRPVYFFEIQTGLATAIARSLPNTAGLTEVFFSNVRGMPTHVRLRAELGVSAWHPFANTITLGLYDPHPVQFQRRTLGGVTSNWLPVH